ncbi:MAG: HpcH/HpaI aldolase/citrate lyase family protein [Hyphomicrobiaceae bacterium]
MMRSKLFLPGSRPEFFEKGFRGEADALSFDLEDAVAPEKKASARRHIHDALARLPRVHDKIMIVRVNAVGTPEFAEDIDAIVTTGLDEINLPKLESVDELEAGIMAIEAAEKRKGLAHQIKILVNVESPKGMRLAADIASASPRISGLQYGLGDLFAPNRIDRHEAANAPVRMMARLAAAEAGVPAYCTAWTNIADTLGYEREARAALRLGFSGKTALHPIQVPIANMVFTPSEALVAWSQKVLAAMALPENAGKGAFTVDGKMVDEPFFREARATIDLARRLKLIS